MSPILRLRRGVGVVFVAAGVLHATIMVMATLYSMRLLPFVITARLWSRLYFGHFLALVLGCGLYLALGYRRRGFYFEPLLDFAAGVAGFNVFLTLTAVALVRHWLPAWLSPIPSAFLLAYGLGLMRGRRFGFGKGYAPPREGSEPA